MLTLSHVAQVERRRAAHAQAHALLRQGFEGLHVGGPHVRVVHRLRGLQYGSNICIQNQGLYAIKHYYAGVQMRC